MYRDEARNCFQRRARGSTAGRADPMVRRQATRFCFPTQPTQQSHERCRRALEVGIDGESPLPGRCGLRRTSIVDSAPTGEKPGLGRQIVELQGSLHVLAGTRLSGPEA